MLTLNGQFHKNNELFYFAKNNLISSRAKIIYKLRV